MAHVSSIGPNTVVRGSVRGDGDLDIQGRVEGSVVVRGELTIGEGALIKCDVTGRRVIVRGAVAGNVFADESVVLEKGARVVGDLGAPQIGIRPGALVRGNVSTGGGDGAAAARSRAATAPAVVRAAPRSESRAKPAGRGAPAVRPVARVAAPAAMATPPTRSNADGGARAPAAAVKRTPPPPVVPALKKGVKSSLKRKAAR